MVDLDAAARATISGVDAESTSRTVTALGVETLLHDAGDGPPVLLLHGSGPGVSAWSNWRPVFPELSRHFRLVAPDQVGFNKTQADGDVRYGRRLWTDHALALVDELGLETFSIVGNSMGGAIALSVAAARPEAVDRIVVMGTMGVAMALPDGLAEVWGYEPSPEAMRSIIELFAHDHRIVTDELVEMRFRASDEPTARDAFSGMFPEPRQDGVDDLALSPEELRSIRQPVLLVHGFHDRIIPLASSSLPLMELLPDAELHAFGNSGHWVMIEQTAAFNAAVRSFLEAGG